MKNIYYKTDLPYSLPTIRLVLLELNMPRNYEKTGGRGRGRRYFTSTEYDFIVEKLDERHAKDIKFKADTARARTKDHKCRECGTSNPKDFYANSKTMCKEHYRANNNKRKAEQRKQRAEKRVVEKKKQTIQGRIQEYFDKYK